MSSNIAFLKNPVARYLTDHTTPPSPLEQRLIDRTHELTYGDMQIGHPQAQFMAALTRLLQPSLVVEVGTFTGYSALVVAQQLPEDSRLIACDVSDEWTSIGREFWAEAGVADKIDLRIGPASETLAAFDPDATVDMAFIDADKTGYLGYFEQLVPMLSERGVILVDNVLWDGAVASKRDKSADTVALREFSAHVLADPRVNVALLPIGDGLSFITLA
ncbi:MAG: class I SAM-dependent methyltransferase [Actinomycetota bacterium]